MRQHAGLRALHLAGQPEHRRLLVARVERVGLVYGQVDAVEAVDEVDVPPVAAELAVGDRLDADRLLQRDHVADAAVLHRFQLGLADLALSCLRPRLVQLLRAQQAADMVGTERRFHYAASFSASALSVASQVNSGSARPKWP